MHILVAYECFGSFRRCEITAATLADLHFEELAMMRQTCRPVTKRREKGETLYETTIRSSRAKFGITAGSHRSDRGGDQPFSLR